MKSAREIACPGGAGGCWVIGHSDVCDARTEVIQAAREEGAKWALGEVYKAQCDESFHLEKVNGSDVRKVAP